MSAFASYTTLSRIPSSWCSWWNLYASPMADIPAPIVTTRSLRVGVRLGLSYSGIQLSGSDFPYRSAGFDACSGASADAPSAAAEGIRGSATLGVMLRWLSSNAVPSHSLLEGHYRTTGGNYSPVSRAILINVDSNNPSEVELDLTLTNGTTNGEMRRMCPRMQRTIRKAAPLSLYVPRHLTTTMWRGSCTGVPKAEMRGSD